ncbi:MAG: histidinol dehydrogenase [Gaiellales bacterium]|nr:MAG: histidinol dehydrogenase [Gaiellales bacterium]
MQHYRLTTENIDEVLADLRAGGAESAPAELEAVVAEIIGRVREEGDQALIDYNRRFDCPDFTGDMLAVPPEETAAALEQAPGALVEALKLAADNIRFFHQHEMRGGWNSMMRQSQMLGQRMMPVDRVGLYVPGGGASYPSSVLMTAIPAQVAGVRDLFICTPPDSRGNINSAVLAAAALLEIDEVYRVGGAQAVAAMAFGTDAIHPADVVCGPGNVFVTEAKRQVYGQVGIDGLAGPSEVLIIADESARPELIAIDLLAQVEHGSGAIAAVVCWSEKKAAAVEEILGMQAAELGIPAEQVERAAIITIEGAEDPLALAIAFSNRFGPEHLQIHTDQPEQDVHDVTCAGAVFLGENTCTAYGDYIAGSNHVLPTGGSARFTSGLSVDNFMRKVAVISLIPQAIAELTPSLEEIAGTEGLKAHARAARMRQELFVPREEE